MPIRVLDISLYHLIKQHGRYYASGRVFSDVSETFEISGAKYYLARLAQWLHI